MLSHVGQGAGAAGLGRVFTLENVCGVRLAMRKNSCQGVPASAVLRKVKMRVYRLAIPAVPLQWEPGCACVSGKNLEFNLAFLSRTVSSCLRLQL